MPCYTPPYNDDAMYYGERIERATKKACSLTRLIERSAWAKGAKVSDVLSDAKFKRHALSRKSPVQLTQQEFNILCMLHGPWWENHQKEDANTATSNAYAKLSQINFAVEEQLKDITDNLAKHKFLKEDQKHFLHVVRKSLLVMRKESSPKKTKSNYTYVTNHTLKSSLIETMDSRDRADILDTLVAFLIVRIAFALPADELSRLEKTKRHPMHRYTVYLESAFSARVMTAFEKLEKIAEAVMDAKAKTLPKGKSKK